jgi:hypothetical protein
MGSFREVWADISGKPELSTPPDLKPPAYETWKKINERLQERNPEAHPIILETYEQTLQRVGCGRPNGAPTIHIRVGDDILGSVSHGYYQGTLRFDISLHKDLRGLGLYHACLEHVLSMYETKGDSVFRLPALMHNDSSATSRAFFNSLQKKYDSSISDLLNNRPSESGQAFALRCDIIEAASELSITHVRRKCGFGNLSAVTVVPDPFNGSSPNHGIYLEFFKGEPLEASQVFVRLLTQDTETDETQKLSEQGWRGAELLSYPILPMEEATLVELGNSGGASEITSWDSSSILGSYSNINIPRGTSMDDAWTTEKD